MGIEYRKDLFDTIGFAKATLVRLRGEVKGKI